MRKFINRLLIFLLPSLATSASLIAQDTDIVERQQSLLSKRWQDAQKNQSGVYNGREYLDYTRLLKEGHAYLDTTAIVGSLRYNHVTYDGLPLKVDLIKEELIVRHFNNVFLIQLVKDKIDWFNIGIHRFEYLGRDSLESGIKPGFYDRVYSGSELKFYVRRLKVIQEVIENLKIERIVHPADKFFILKDGKFHAVRSKSSVIKLLGHKKEINFSLRQKNIRFKANRELAIKTMVEVADTL